jgi:hypothetical protein
MSVGALRWVFVVAFASVVTLASCVGDDPAVVAGGADDAGGTPPDSSVADAPVGPGDSAPPSDASPSDAQDATFDDAGIAGVGGALLWFSADKNLADNGAGLVTRWTSRAGSPLVLMPLATATSPSLGLINGHPSVHFDGHLVPTACPCPSMSVALPAPLPQPLTVFAVFRSDRLSDGTNNYESVIFRNAAGTFKLHTSFEPGPSVAFAVNAGTKLLSAFQTNITYLKPHLITAVMSGVSSLVRIDGDDTSERTGSAGLGSLSTDLVLAGDGTPVNSFQGDIGELVFYGRVLSLSERGAVEVALKTKWSIP